MEEDLQALYAIRDQAMHPPAGTVDFQPTQPGFSSVQEGELVEISTPSPPRT